MKSPSYEQEDSDGYLPTPAILFRSTSRWKDGSGLAKRWPPPTRSTTRPTSPRSSTGSSIDPVPVAKGDRVGAPLLETKMICDLIRTAVFRAPAMSRLARRCAAHHGVSAKHLSRYL